MQVSFLQFYTDKNILYIKYLLNTQFYEFTRKPNKFCFLGVDTEKNDLKNLYLIVLKFIFINYQTDKIQIGHGGYLNVVQSH